MTTLGFKLLRALLMAILFGIIVFLISGLGACLYHLIEYHGNRPEMVGWWGIFLIVGCICFILNSGALIVTFIFSALSQATNNWIVLFVCIEALFSGVLFLFLAETYILVDKPKFFLFWILFTVLFIVGWMIGRYIQKLLPSKLKSMKSVD